METTNVPPITCSTPLPTPAMKGIPSLSSPPKAPRKSKTRSWRSWRLEGRRLLFPVEDETKRRNRKLKRLREEEREEYQRWPIQHKYLKWTPMEIEEINNLNLLHFLYGKYAFPSSQPQNDKERTFLDIMKETILFRMLSLKHGIL